MQEVDYSVVQSTNKEYKSTNKEKIYYMKCKPYAMSFYISEIAQMPRALLNFIKASTLRGFVKVSAIWLSIDIKFKRYHL